MEKLNVRAVTTSAKGLLRETPAENVKIFEDNPELWESVRLTSPLPNHIANGAVYLASDAAKAVTGTELVIDNGSMTH